MKLFRFLQLFDLFSSIEDHRIITNGVRIANSKGVPGTLGCIAYSDSIQAPVLLSNYHVLFGRGSTPDSDIWYVENETEKKFTRIGKSLKGKIGGVFFNGQYTFIDCAIGTLNDTPSKPISKPQEPGIEIAGIAESVIGEPVTRIGGNTSNSTGNIVDTNYSTVSMVDGTIYPALNQILIQSADGTKFADKGDSGSIVLNKENKIVGLVWSVTTDGEGIACPILPIMEALNITLRDRRPKQSKNIKQRINHLLKEKFYGKRI